MIRAQTGLVLLDSAQEEPVEGDPPDRGALHFSQ